MTHERAIGTRALWYAIALAAALFVTLAASVLARNIVAESFAQYAQPFTSWLPESTAASLAIMMAASIVLGIAFYLLFSRFASFNDTLSRVRAPRWLPLRFARRDIAVAAGAVFLLWLPITVIMYPTGLTADTLNQLYQFQTAAPTYYPTTGALVDAEFIDHHPVFDTLLYGLFWRIGNALGSQNGGIFALAVVQSALLAAELGLLVCYLEQLGVAYPLRAAALAFIALFPAFGHYACTVLKDSTYLTVFIPFAIMWIEVARTRGKALESKRFLAALFVFGGLSIITKKLGVFALVPCLVVLVIAMRGYRKRLIVGSGATLVVFCALLPAIVYPAIGGVAPGGKQEVIGPAIQQVTALLIEEPDALSPEELADVNKVFNVKRAKRNFEPFRSDHAKSAFRDSATTADIGRFLLIWASQGVRHPKTYLASLVETSGMLYIPIMKLTYYTGEDLDSRMSNYAKRNADFAVDVSQPEALVKLNDYLEFDSVESKISDLPVISLFFTQGFYGSWVVLIALALALFARRRGNFTVFGLVPLLVCAVLLLASPVASPRYVLPLLFASPLALGWAWRCLALATARS